MNINYLYFFCTSLFFIVESGFLFGQKGIQPRQEDFNLASQLNEKYEGTEIVALESSDVFRFGFDSKTKNVTVEELNSEKLMCIKSRAKIVKSKFYDAKSAIKKVSVFHRNKKKAVVNPKYENYNQSGIFYSDAMVCYFPLLFETKGYQYQVDFKKEYHDVKYFTRTYFTSPYPVLKKRVQFIIPKWLNIELKEINFEKGNIRKKIKYDESQNADIYTFEASDLKGMASEENSYGPAHIYPHLLILAKSHEAENQSQTLFNSTQDLYNWYKKVIGTLENDPDQTKTLAETLTQTAQNDIERAKSVYYWVQDNIRYIAYEDGIAGFKPDASQNVYNKKYGDCKGMANLTKQMLLSLGFDARLTWIGTKRIPYDYDTPSLAVDNHMICTLILDGKKYFLDPTEKYNSFGEYAERIQGKQVLIEDGENFILERIPVMTKDHNTETIIKEFGIKDDVLVGAGKHSFKGESKTHLLYLINNIEKNKVQEVLEAYLTSSQKNFSVTEIKTSDPDNRDDELEINYNFERKNALSFFGDEIYLDIDFYKEFQNFKFDIDRLTDYVFTHKLHHSNTLKFIIPEDYKISEIPKDFLLKHDDFSFEIKYQLTGNMLTYTKEISINKAVVKVKDFKIWNEYIDQLKETYQQQIILAKK